jgi:RNA polymerase sigma factor (sigma-70 family)
MAAMSAAPPIPSPPAPLARSDPSEDFFDRLFLDEYARLVGLAARVLGERDEAEDVVQEVFVAFHARYRAAAPGAGAWLRAATLHTALNRIRSRRRRSRREARHARLEEPVRRGQHGMLEPERMLEQDEQRQLVRAALARLRRRQAAVLLLRHSGFSYAETAAALGVEVGQVGTMVRRAEQALRREIGDG